jgi:hypothetical protein
MLSARIHEAATALHAAGIRIESGETWLVAQCDHATLAAAMREAGATCDALIVDAPYSARTHESHDDGAVQANRGDDYRSRVTKPTGGTGERRLLDYMAWSDDDARAFVAVWHALASGWIVSLTDHVLAPAWGDAMEAAYRYSFSPIACVERASRARLLGDGPPQWSTWAVVSRPRDARWVRWATIEERARRGADPIPGAYVGGREAKDVVGGKPLWLMRALVRDYSAPGALVCDPCMGAGTTLVAAVEEGRLALGCEPDAGRFELAVGRLRRARRQAALPLTRDTRTADQLGLPEGEVG